MKTALLLRMKAKPGHRDAVRECLVEAAQSASNDGPRIPWYTLRFRRSEFGLFAAFVDDTARKAHATQLGMDILERAEPLLAQPPEITTLDVLASKLPGGANMPPPSTKAMLLTFNAKAGHVDQVADVLGDMRRFVLDEHETTAWFAIGDDRQNYGIFDVFPNSRGRLKHFAGHVPRELAKHGRSLLGRVPHLDLPEVIADHARYRELLSAVTP